MSEKRKTSYRRRKQPKEKTSQCTKVESKNSQSKNLSSRNLQHIQIHPSTNFHHRNSEIVEHANAFTEDESIFSLQTPSPENKNTFLTTQKFDEKLFLSEMQVQMESIQHSAKEIDSQNKQHKQMIKNDLFRLVFPQTDHEESNLSFTSILNISTQVTC